jgi:hypothetical protein
MRRFLMILPMLFLATAASADMAEYHNSMPRHDLSKMTCAEVKATLQSEGSAIFTWTSSSGMPRHAKYASPDRSCKMQQMKAMTTIKASDGSCRVATCGQYGRSPTRM